MLSQSRNEYMRVGSGAGGNDEGLTATVDPGVAPHSGQMALINRFEGDLGSTTLMRFRTSKIYDMVRVFVGMEEPSATREPVTAILRAYALGRRPVGESRVTFAASAQPIVHCLMVEAAQQIYEVTVEYISGPTWAYEPELIDDLMFGAAALPPQVPPDDQPPRVTILSPRNNSTITDWSGFRITGRIEEERRLNAVRITGAGRQSDLRVQRLPDNSYSFEFGVPGDWLEKGKGYGFEVTAYDEEGNGKQSVRILFNPPAILDIIAVQYEITQGIQCVNHPNGDRFIEQYGSTPSLSFCRSNTMPLIEHRPTLIRFYVRTNSEDPVDEVTGQLCLQGRCLGALQPVTAFPDLNPVSQHRGDLNKTLNFMVPYDWTAGQRQFTLTVNPGSAIEECRTCAGNNQLQAPSSFQEGKRVDVVMSRVRTLRATARDADRGPTVRPLSWLYPGRVRVWQPGGDASTEGTYDYVEDDGEGCRDGWEALLHSLWWDNYWTDDPVSWLRYYGMVPEVTPHGSGEGCGWRPGDESAGTVNNSSQHSIDYAGETMAHEVAHSHGRRHGPGCGAGGADRNAPLTSDGKMTISNWGIDLRTMTLKNPANTYDFMGYCSPFWVSPYTYVAMHSAIMRVAQAPSDAAGALPPFLSPEPALAAPPPEQAGVAGAEYLVGSFDIKGDRVELGKHGFYRAPWPKDGKIRMKPDGRFALQLRDSQGAILASHPFDLRQTGDGNSESGIAQVTVPWAPGTSVIAVTKGPQEVFSKAVSPNPPTVKVTSPAPDANWGARGVRTIAWEGADSDGDKLTYSVRYSPNEGVSWVSLGSGLSRTSMRIDAADLAGADKALIQVLATDGINTASDAIDGPFSVADKGPQAFIASPTNDQRYNTGREVIFNAYATDMEDQALDDGAYRWSSDLQGGLGAGPELWALNIRDGRHKITLTVKDKDGRVARQSVEIMVGRRNSILLWIAASALLLVAILALALLRNRRRRGGAPSAGSQVEPS